MKMMKGRNEAAYTQSIKHNTERHAVMKMMKGCNEAASTQSIKHSTERHAVMKMVKGCNEAAISRTHQKYAKCHVQTPLYHKSSFIQVFGACFQCN